MNTKLYTETELNTLRSMPKRITNPPGSLARKTKRETQPLAAWISRVRRI